MQIAGVVCALALAAWLWAMRAAVARSHSRALRMIIADDTLETAPWMVAGGHHAD